MLNIENMRKIFESTCSWQSKKRKDGEYSDRHVRADWSLFQKAFTAGYELAKGESNWVNVNNSDITHYTSEDLFLLVNGKVILGRYDRDCFTDTAGFIVEPTRYMRVTLPEPPTE